ncbi:MAG: YfiR family protein [Planctomycetota bacterium]|jgi:hypothetical protein
MMKQLIDKFFVIVMVTWLLLLAGGRSACWASVTYASDTGKRQATEYEIKAVYLYNFLLFVHWPDEQSSSTGAGSSRGSAAEVKSADGRSDSEQVLTIGIVGDDPFGDAFAQVEGKLIKSKQKTLIIKRFGRYRKELDLYQCQLLFISPSERDNYKTILESLNGCAMLTVADNKGFLECGGMINLVKIEKKIRWEINQRPVRKAGLRLSSQLLRNAVRVVEIPEDSEKSSAAGGRFPIW